MSQQPGNTANLQKALLFFKRSSWTRLTEALYEKYIEQGRVGGQVILHRCTPEEMQEIARFLGKALPAADTLSVRLADFQQALAQSSFACELPELLLVLFPERSHTTRLQQKEQRARLQQQFSADLAALLEKQPIESRGAYWLMNGKHGREALLRQHKNEPGAVQEAFLASLQMIVRALDQLPAPPSFQYLSHFALQISGDPHFLDINTANGYLFLAALADLRELSENGSGGEGEEDALDMGVRSGAHDHWRHLLYYESGLLLDTVSSTVAVFHLHAALEHNGQADACIACAGERVLVLPLRQLLAWKGLFSASKQIYLFENPQVFELIVDRLQQAHSTPGKPSLPTLVCTSGWPSIAAIRFLNLLTESSPDIQLYYSGDFDLQGLRIASYLLARYPRQCLLWRFDPSAYRVALHHQGAALAAQEITSLQTFPDVFSELVREMQNKQKKAYQEGITQLLLDDIQAAL